MAKVAFLTFYLDYSIGVYVLSSILEDNGHEVAVFFFKQPSREKISWFRPKPDYYEQIDWHGNITGFHSDINPWTAEEIHILAQEIKEYAPDILCISSKSTDNSICQRIIPAIRQYYSGLTIAGGFGPSLSPEFYADLVDYVYIGEAENAINEIAEFAGSGKSLRHLPNIAYKSKGCLYKNQLRQPDINLFTIQRIPAQTFVIEHNKCISSQDNPELIHNQAYSTFFGRGCISSCSYCSAGQWRKFYKHQDITIPKRRNRRLADLMAELNIVKSKGYTFIHFRDEFLCANTKVLLEFFTRYEREICLPFWAYLVPQQVLEHPRLLTAAVDAGLVDTEIGFQSGSDWINRHIFNRRISNKKTLSYARLLAAHHINVKYDFIIFNPAETGKDIALTFELIRKLPKKRCYLQLARLFSFPMAPISSIMQEYTTVKKSTEMYYKTALLYLCRFLLSDDNFNKLLQQRDTLHSNEILQYYQDYIRDHNIEFQIGTHAKAEAITTQRFKRLLGKRQEQEIIVWGKGDYYQDLKHIFSQYKIRHHFDDRGVGPEELKRFLTGLQQSPTPLSIYICTSEKQRVKKLLLTHLPDYQAMIFV